MTPKTAILQTPKLMLTLFAFLGTSALAHADEVKDFLDKARQHLESKSDQAHIQLKILEPSGEQKVREMNLRWLRSPQGFKAMVRMTSPADVKGTALLSEAENSEHQEWLYVPSTKQVRRVATSNKSAGVLGSELSPEDLDPVGFKEAAVKLNNSNPKVPILEVTPKAGSSAYSKVLTTFSMPDYLPQKTEYFKNDTLEKTVNYSDYKLFDGKIYRAQKVHIVNIAKNRGTDLELTDIKVNPSLSAKDFSPNALKDSW